jgi:hypothetical protein
MLASSSGIPIIINTAYDKAIKQNNFFKTAEHGLAQGQRSTCPVLGHFHVVNGFNKLSAVDAESSTDGLTNRKILKA